MPPSLIPNQDNRNLDKRADALLAAPEDIEALNRNWKEITRKSGLAIKPIDQRLDRARSAACTMLGLSDNEINRGHPAVERVAAAMEGKMIAPDEAQILKQQKAGKFVLVFGACMAFGLFSILTGIWWLGFLLVCGAVSMAWVA